MTAPVRLSVVYATDEDIVATAGADFVNLAAKSARLALGADGYFDVPEPWTLRSPSTDFLALGVTSNMIINLTGPSSHFRTNELLAVDSASGDSLVLRWPGQALNVGFPPGRTVNLGEATGVKFEIRTLSAQIEDACYEINERFGIDPAKACRSPDSIYDQRTLRNITVYWVLANAYANGTRDEKGDWSLKAGRYKGMLDDAIARASVRWGPTGDSQPPSNVFGARLRR